MCVKNACETEGLAATTFYPGGGGQRHGRPMIPNTLASKLFGYASL